ncbi:bacterial Ig-like domain-containing protein [Butyrivibrio sp. YAB3001]|uniref:bacterial Ig-like domain-containing protein n=1 Tax=Butyrivibrio sp. YAB3001 TaxID=1520812 RepID=UPI0008F637C8|nr:bacterial Ig-like domain-containing protein [Butyrivibrio sp. YAB3001]SFD03513.1 Ig-like domain (group 3) [Butyrivibrio sp. YAB3001]
MLERLKNKAIGSYFCLAAALVALVTGICFLMTQEVAAPLGHTGTMPGVVLLVGAVISIVMFFVPVRFGAFIQAVIYNVALYLVVVQLYFVFADVINHVTFAGGNPTLCVFYMAGTFVAALLCVIACFMKQTKVEEEVKPAKDFATGGVLAAIACAAIFGLSFVDVAPATEVLASSSDVEDPYSMNLSDNSFAGKSIEELAAISRDDWEAKEANGEIAYFFEGQYTEGFSTIVDPACLDMYCAVDGSMYGTFSGPTTSVGGGQVMYVYGYWYNHDENGDRNFVVHITGTQDSTGATRAVNVEGGEDADVFIFDTEHGDYTLEASLSFGLSGGMFTRNINIYGMPYAAAQSIAIDSSKLRTFYTGDAFDAGELVVTAVRANGSEESIWNGRLNYDGFDSATTGTKKVTGSFLGQSQEFEVKVEQLVTESFAGSYEFGAGESTVAADAILLIDYSHKTITIAALDGSAAITGTIVNATDSAVTATLNGSQPVEIALSEEEGVKSAVIPAHDEVVIGWTATTTYSIGECSFTLQ